MLIANEGKDVWQYHNRSIKKRKHRQFALFLSKKEHYGMSWLKRFWIDFLILENTSPVPPPD